MRLLLLVPNSSTRRFLYPISQVCVVAWAFDNNLQANNKQALKKERKQSGGDDENVVLLLVLQFRGFDGCGAVGFKFSCDVGRTTDGRANESSSRGLFRGAGARPSSSRSRHTLLWILSPSKV